MLRYFATPLLLIAVSNSTNAADHSGKAYNSSTLSGEKIPALYSVAVGPKNEVLASDVSGVVSLWTTSEHTHDFWKCGEKTGVENVAMSNDGTRILCGTWSGKASLLDAPSMRVLEAFDVQHAQRGKLQHFSGRYAVAFSPVAKECVAGSDGPQVYLWDTTTFEPMRTLHGHVDSVSSAVFSGDGTELLTGSLDHEAILWNARSGKELRRFRGHGAAINAVAISPDGRYVATASDDSTAIVWDKKSGEKLHTLRGHQAAVESIVFTPDGKRVVTGSYDTTAAIWNTATGLKEQQLDGHDGCVMSVACSHDGSYTLTASFDGTIGLWRSVDGKCLATLLCWNAGKAWLVFKESGDFDCSPDAQERFRAVYSGKTMNGPMAPQKPLSFRPRLFGEIMAHR